MSSDGQARQERNYGSDQDEVANSDAIADVRRERHSIDTDPLGA